MANTTNRQSSPKPHVREGRRVTWKPVVALTLLGAARHAGVFRALARQGWAAIGVTLTYGVQALYPAPLWVAARRRQRRPLSSPVNLVVAALPATWRHG